MSGTPSYIAQEWSVHAQLTISHRRPDAALATSRDDNGVQMEYSWSTVPPAPAGATTPPPPAAPRVCYGFQRGNITFETRPPGASPSLNQRLHDSGYNSERLSPGFYGSLPTRKSGQQPYNRRCRSTCSITLSEVKDDEDNGVHATVNRSNSLKTPSGARYQCSGDDEPNDLNHPGLTKKKNVSPVEEVCEVCGGERSPSAQRRAANYTTHFCTRVPDKAVVKHCQDAASQTTQQEDARPASRTAQPRCQVGYNARRRTDTDLLQIPVLELPQAVDSAEGAKPGKRLSRSPARLCGKSPLLRKSSSRSPEHFKKTRASGKSPLLRKSPSRSPERVKTTRVSVKSPLLRKSPSRSPERVKTTRVSGKSPLLRKSPSRSPERVKTTPTSTAHKPRTVHIDVYCTGSDASSSDSVETSSDSSLDSDAGESWTSPQTVFESEQVRVVHTRAAKGSLPHALRPRDNNETSKPRDKQAALHCRDVTGGRSTSYKCPAVRDRPISRGYDSDDGLSSQYPSRLSSYTSMRDSSWTSFDPSSSTISCSSCAFTEDYDSTAPTSCKDTATDLDSTSLVNCPLSLAASDSFEYADSLDRQRIKERERAWASHQAEESKTWRSPESERKQMMQRQKFREFLERHVGKSTFPLWKATKTDDSDTDDGDETGDAWSFGGESASKVTTLKREDTVRRATPAHVTQAENKIATSETGSDAASVTLARNTSAERASQHRRRTPSPSPAPLKIQSSVTSPFTTRVGVRTAQLSKAERFGTIVGAFRKPGHHVGPSKNPECSCAHCRNYWAEVGFRSRTRSLDASLETADNWKSELQEQLARKTNGGNTPSGKTTGANVKDGAQSAVCEDVWDDSTAV